jgi:hypothetical protein
MTRQVTLVRPPPGAGTKCPDPYGHCLDQGPIEVPTDRRRAVTTRWFRDFGTPAEPQSASMQWPGLNIDAYSPEPEMRASAALKIGQTGRMFAAIPHATRRP